MVRYKLSRLLKRILWKLFPKTNAQCIDVVRLYVEGHRYPAVKTIDETIDALLQKPVSIARYGDGEFTLCFGRPIGFQKADKKLESRLREILKSNTQNCLVALPECTIENISDFWIRYWFENFGDIVKLFNPQTSYFNQGISREFTLEQIQRLKQLWENRSVVFVYGKGSRFNASHELFSEIAEFSVVYGLPCDAWSEYPHVLHETEIEAQKFKKPLILISLGPTATVLAFDLSQKGFQAIDIGHITSMFDTLKYGKAKPEELPIS